MASPGTTCARILSRVRAGWGRCLAAAGIITAAALAIALLIPAGSATARLIPDHVARPAPASAAAFTGGPSLLADASTLAAARRYQAREQERVLLLASYHAFHEEHLAHLARVRELALIARAAAARTAPTPTPSQTGSSLGAGCHDPSGYLTQSQVGMLWLCAGGPAWAEARAVEIAHCESGWWTRAYNSSSGASGEWQILGAPVGWTGSTDWFDAAVNASAAVAKFRESHDTFAQWVCQ
jgi:hypothetical protein